MFFFFWISGLCSNRINSKIKMNVYLFNNSPGLHENIFSLLDSKNVCLWSHIVFLSFQVLKGLIISYLPFVLNVKRIPTLLVLKNILTVKSVFSVLQCYKIAKHPDSFLEPVFGLINFFKLSLLIISVR